ncbi:MAG: iron-containing alcohol dehydrogenase [Kiritimatiellae bacterium]|nr:iron-containing alcohol dehydrogenase [Kiritimatiellia bacterium]
MMTYGLKDGSEFLSKWLEGKDRIVLVTGRGSYAKCGAEAWLAPFLKDKKITHLKTAGENARKENVEELLKEVGEAPDAYIAVGGGTVIDTTKLLRGEAQIPYIAIPTTAGTGAEATRFAVYYDHGKKCSADNLCYLPTDQILIPEFCASASAYQKASCAFDAYAQAVESLWAKGATDESRGYAKKALELMAKGEQLLGSYWAGRAIDISRTTAAHAFSYYMTATYGVPHGEAVYMMFPAVCRANGHPEYIKPVAELRTLTRFAEEKCLDRGALIDKIFENVNPARLSNNPCEVRKEHFV